MIRGSNPGGGEIFRTLPDRPWGPHSPLYIGYHLVFQMVKRSGRGISHPPPSSAEVKERVQLYLYSPYWASWLVLGWTLYQNKHSIYKVKQIPVVVCSKAWVCSCSCAGIAGSNPAEGMEVCLLWVLCVVTPGHSLVQRNPTECGVFNWVWSWSLKNGDVLAH